MAKRSKYATLDAVILQCLRERPEHGSSHSRVVNYGAVRSFARVATEHKAPSVVTVSRRLQALHKRGRIANNGTRGDGCRWYAAP